MGFLRLFKGDLARESLGWVKEGIITREQAEVLCSRYGVGYGSGVNRSRVYSIFFSLAYLFIGVSMIILIGRNWGEVPRWVRMWGLILLTLSVHGLGLRRFLDGRRNVAVGMFFLGNLFYGASIILIAQIYHLGEHMPDGIFWWAFGSLPFALLMNSSLLMMLSGVLSLVWFFVEAGMGFYPVLFPVFLLSALMVLIRGKQSFVLFLLFIGGVTVWIEYALFFFWEGGTMWWLWSDFHPEFIVISIALFIFFYALSDWLGYVRSVKARDYGALLGLWCLRFGFVFILILSFEFSWDSLIRESWDHAGSMAVIVIPLLGMSWWMMFRRRYWKMKTVVIVLFLLILGGVMGTSNPEHGLYFTLLFNVFGIVVSIGLIMRGIQAGISQYFYLGVMMILAIALIRYFQLVGGYVGGAGFFAFLAILFIVVARLWKRYMLNREAS